MGLNIDREKEELNRLFIETIEKHIRIADKYGFDRNTLLRQMGEKMHIATEVSDFSNYVCKEEKEVQNER